MKRSRYRDAQLIDLHTEQRMLLLDPDHLQGPGRDATLYLVSSVSNAAKSFR